MLNYQFRKFNDLFTYSTYFLFSERLQGPSSSQQLSQDEALARALASEEDEALARALQASLNEQQQGGYNSRNHQSNHRTQRQVTRLIRFTFSMTRKLETKIFQKHSVLCKMSKFHVTDFWEFTCL